jgi:hypothetical protein
MRRARVGRALLVAVAVGSSLTALSAHAAGGTGCPASQPCLAVHLPDGSVQYVDIDTINSEASAAQAAHAPNAVPAGITYPGSDNVINLGLSVNALIQDLDPTISPTFTELPRAPNVDTTAILKGDNLAAPSNFEQGLLPAFWVNGNVIDYVRAPLDSSDNPATDDGIVSQEDGPLDFYVYTGPMLTVTDSATTTRPKVGQPVTFTASATLPDGSPDSAQLTYTWTFSDDATPVVQPTVTRSFGSADQTYEVLLRVSGTDGSGGVADPIEVAIPRAKTSPPTPPPTQTPGGGHSSTPSSPKPGQSLGHGTQQPTNPATVRPTPSVTPSAPSGTGSAHPSASASAATTATTGAQPGTAHTTPPNSTAVLDNNLPLVHGQLIGPGAVVVAGAQPEAVQAGVSPAGRLSPGWRDVGLIGAIAAIMLLFAAGAARELRWFRH